jgi:hypothetical protein
MGFCELNYEAKKKKKKGAALNQLDFFPFKDFL